MMSKKNLLMLGIAVVGGLGVASMVDADGGGAGGAGEARYRYRAGGILGSAPAPATAPSIINIPAESFTGFPAPPTFDVMRFLQPQPEQPVGTVSSLRKGGIVSKTMSYGGSAKTKKVKSGGIVSKTMSYGGSGPKQTPKALKASRASNGKAMSRAHRIAVKKKQSEGGN